MKKGIVAILLLGICLSFLGVFPILKLQQYQAKKIIRHQILQGIPLHQLTKLSFHYSDKIDWEEASKELVFQKEHYDVVHKIAEGDTIRYFCIHDKAESDLHVQIDQYLAQQKEKNKQNSVCNQFYKFLFQIVNENHSIHIQLFDLGNASQFYVNKPLEKVSLTQLSPPPDHLV